MTNDNLENERYGLDFDLSKSLRYHAYRRAVWSAYERYDKIATFFAGAGVFISIIVKHPLAMQIFGLGVAAISGLNLIIDFGKNARSHDSLYKSFSLLLIKVVAAYDLDEQKIAEFRRQRLELEMDEPTTIRVLERFCSAEEAQARGLPLRDAWILNFWQKFRVLLFTHPTVH